MGLAALGFVVWTFEDLGRRWDPNTLSVSWWLVALSTLPLAAGGLLQAWGWTLLLSRMSGKPVPWAPAIALHVESMMARYVPGKVGLPLVRMAGAATLGVEPAVAGVSVFIEMLSFSAMGGVVGFGTLALAHGQTRGQEALLGPWFTVLLVGFAVGVAALMFVDRKYFPKALLRRIGAGGAGPLVPLILPLIHAAYWGTWVLHGYLMALAIGASHAAALAAAGFFPVALIAGFLALVAPAGAGVREAILSAGMAPVVGATGALSAAVLSRITTLVVELSVFLLTRPLARKRHQEAR